MFLKFRVISHIW